MSTSAKLHPPVHGNLLFRERLLDQLSQNASKKVFLIDGCAGSGKTVLALQFLNTLDLEPAWISLDQHDRDPALFFAYLTAAIRSLCPGFGQELGFRTVTSVETWASFLHALQNRIEKPLYIVLDNFECINGAAEVNEFLSYLIQHLPYSVHIVFLCSRTPRFSLRNYGLSNGLCHLKASDLAFTVDEALQLFEEGFGGSMSPSAVRSILDETEGWTLALVLMGQHMRNREAFRKNRKFAAPQKHYDAIHEYFLEDVLKPLPGRMGELMVSSALLPFLSPNELRLYMGSENAEVLLSHFRGSNVPIFPLSAGSETFRYHKMFRRFLLDNANERKSDADLTHLHRQAGSSLKRNYPVEAIDHYLSVGDVAEAMAILEKLGSDLLRQGRYDTLKMLVNKIPLEKGRVQEGVRTLQESTTLFKKSFNFCGQFWNEFNLCMLLTRQGNLSEAWECWKSMERNSRQLALPLQQAMTLIVDALLSAMEQAPEKTIGNLSKAKALLKGSQQRMSVFHGHILSLKAYETIGRRDLAEETFLESISPDDPKHYCAAIHFELHWFLPFVERVMQKALNKGQYGMTSHADFLPIGQRRSATHPPGSPLLNLVRRSETWTFTSMSLARSGSPPTAGRFPLRPVPARGH